MFESVASDLVASDTNLVSDVYLFDRETRSLERISGDSHLGAYEPTISADGSVIAYRSVEDGISQIRLYSRSTNSSVIVSSSNSIVGNADSTEPSVSADGNYIVYTSAATNLAVDINLASDVFVYNVVEQTIKLVSKWFG